MLIAHRTLISKRPIDLPKIVILRGLAPKNTEWLVNNWASYRIYTNDTRNGI